MEPIVVRAGWRERLEELASEQRRSVVLAAIVGLAIVVAIALWARGAPAQVAPPATASRSAPAATASTPSTVVLVHVAGAVRRPGLYEFAQGARVADAIEAARGPKPRADLAAVNLAELLVDGMKLEVPVVGSAPPAVPAPTPSSAATVGINSADQAALETVPGIGPVKAAAIVEYRTQAGGFTSLEQLLDVPGIGPSTLDAIRPYITL